MLSLHPYRAKGNCPMFEKLGKFEINRILGNGAMGEVYLGVDPSIGREVAIKTILPSAAQGGDAKERFAREARAAGVLNHPNLVTIYEFGEDQGVLYIAMEFVKGHDLDELLNEQSLSRSEALEVLAQVCDGLGFAHRQAIVHRDIKPTNVRVQRDGRRLHAKVMDFGVAKISNSDMTATGMVMGTVSYMAPEYIRTGKPDPRSDLFAVGVMLYESLSGRKPFSGDTTPTVLYKIVNEEPEPIETEKLQGISPAIRSVLERSLSKNPDDRFQTAEELAKALRAAKDPSWLGQVEEVTTLLRSSAVTAPVAAAPPPASAPTLQTPLPGVPPAPAAQLSRPRPGGSQRGLWLGLTALLLVGAGGTGWWLLRRANPAAPTGPDGAGAAAVLDASSAAGNGPKSLAPGQSATKAALQSDSKGSQAQPPPVGAMPSQNPEPRPPEPRPVQARTPEPRAIEQPELYQPEKLDKLQTHERLALGNVSMSEAIQLADKEPDKAIHGFRQALKADPYNVQAHAWLAVVLHDQGRTPEFHQELREARRQGLLGQMAARNVRFRSALNQARFKGKLPPDVAD